MNKRDTIRAYKKELREVEAQEQVFKQALGSVTRRKWTLKEELEKLGASTPPRKGKRINALSKEQQYKLIASITE